MKDIKNLIISISNGKRRVFYGSAQKLTLSQKLDMALDDLVKLSKKGWL